MVITCSRDGLLAAWRRPGLVVVLWVWNLLFAAVIAIPAWRWWYDSTAWKPEADVLLRRFSLGVMAELLRNDSSPGLLITVFLALAVVAFIGQALVAGGTIEVLTSDDARSLPHRFFRGAGHFFWRFLRVAVVGALTLLISATAVLAAFGPLGRALGEVDWEPAWYLGQVTSLLIIALLALVVVLAVDYARIQMATEDSRRAVVTLFRSLWFVIGHLRATVGLWFVMAAATAALLASYLFLRTVVPSDTAGLILLIVVLQQAAMLVRAGLRVALVGGEIEVWERYNPLVSSFELQVSSPDVAPGVVESAVPPTSRISGPEGL